MSDALNSGALNRCPHCSEPLTQFGKFWMCQEHGQVEPKKPSGPMRIFLSYGHDANAELVARICADLQSRGHDVWFDKSEIRFGDDWRRKITDGIIASNRVLSFLSKHSTRDPGVCLDELAIAIGCKGANIQTILVESEAEVKAPPSIGHIQWLDMHDWKERRAADEPAWGSWYQSKLAEIVRVIESEQSQKFAGEIAVLEEALKPISSDSRIAQLLKKPLVGRTWLFDAVDQWRNGDDRSSRLFWIMGAPGVGKSAFAAHLAHYGRDKVIAVQFIEYDKPDHRTPQRIVRTLAFQLATRLPDYRKLLLALPEINELDRKNPAELFDYLLANPLKLSIGGGRERFLIVIDALDEAGGNGRNELVEMLARNAPRLPEWIGIVVTSRPESEVVAPLQGLNPCALDTSTESNRADIREYLLRELAPQLAGRADADRLIAQILDKSEGVFLYAERFCNDVQHGYLSLDRPEQFPQGLGGVFYQYFQRQFPDLEKFRRDVRPALRAILAAREPLPVEILKRLFNWQDEELHDFTLPLASLFPVTIESGNQIVKPYHKSLLDWLQDEEKTGPYFVSVVEGHRQLANYFLTCWESDEIALSEVVYHLAEASRFEDAKALLFSEEFRGLKSAKLGLASISSDFLCAEKNSKGYYGVAGPAWYLLQYAEKEFQSLIHKASAQGGGAIMSRYLSERREMFQRACQLSECWVTSGCSEQRCARFCREMLLLFVDDLSIVVKVAEVLQQRNGDRCPNGVLFSARKEIESALANVKKTPRLRAGYGPAMVDSAWEILNYEEKALSAALASLDIQPLQALSDIWQARRFRAIADCDSDPWGAVAIAVRDAEEALESKLTRLVQSLLQ